MNPVRTSLAWLLELMDAGARPDPRRRGTQARLATGISGGHPAYTMAYRYRVTDQPAAEDVGDPAHKSHHRRRREARKAAAA